MDLKRLLIANRGEIAVRIMGAATELGIEPYAVYSDDDATALHVLRAAGAYRLAGAGAAAYLNREQMLIAAAEFKCSAVHPGYGFLSENEAFARDCERAGLTFVGPRPDTLALLGDKVAARAFAQECGIPVLAGTDQACTLEQVQAFWSERDRTAALVLKAVAGGGGRGMRIVRDRAELVHAFDQCSREAETAFGNGQLYVEQFVDRARHVEVQVLGDGAGRAVHLYERECSVQRRHQKLIEMAPAPGLPEELRARLFAASVELASRANYLGLGTVEFLVDVAQDAFWFIEANPRLQVEHTVTEEITGVDLVQTQLQLAAGRSLDDLGLGTQSQVPAVRGLAIQLRINAEQVQPDGGIVPQQGELHCFDTPSGPGLRVDTGGYVGYSNNPRFDSLLAKLVVTQPSGGLAAACRRATMALRRFQIGGIKTNRALLMAVVQEPAFFDGQLHTGFLDANIARLAQASGQLEEALDKSVPSTGLVAPSKPDGARQVELGPGQFGAVAPLLGTVVAIQVQAGTEVRCGQSLFVLNAMKMEHEVLAERSGIVATICVAVEQAVSVGQLLAVIEPAEVSEGVQQAAGEVDLDHIRPDLAEVIERHAIGLDTRRPDAVAKRRKTGHRTARENVADLVDDGTFIEYGPLVIAAQRRRRPLAELIEKTPADGLVAGIGCVNGEHFSRERSRCVVMSYDYTVMAGTQGVQNHHKKDRMFELASNQRLPLIFLTEGGGGRPGDTDAMSVSWLDCLAFRYFGKLSGLVPLVGIATGRCFAGNAALFGCCDVTIATDGANIGMGGPAMIEGGGLGVYRPEQVGPVDVQTENGVVDIRVKDEAEAVQAAKKYLSYFQGTLDSFTCVDQRRLRTLIPEQRLRMYDVRQVIDTMADTGSVLELRRGFGHGMVTAFARVEGRPLGIIANNPAHLAGAIDRDGADKAARFMQLCDGHDIPLLMLCDTPGIMVGPESEKEAMVRHASRMFVTACSLTVPFCTIVLRKGYGLGAQLMAGGSFRAPLFIVGWPTSEFGAMGLEGAVKLGFRRELEAIADPVERKAAFDKMVEVAYEMGKGVNLATQFEIDDVIDPAESRKYVVAALESAPQPQARSGKKRPCIDTW